MRAVQALTPRFQKSRGGPGQDSRILGSQRQLPPAGLFLEDTAHHPASIAQLQYAVHRLPLDPSTCECSSMNFSRSSSFMRSTVPAWVQNESCTPAKSRPAQQNRVWVDWLRQDGAGNLCKAGCFLPPRPSSP